MRRRANRWRGFGVLAAAALALGFVSTAVVEEVSWRAAPESYFELMLTNGSDLLPGAEDLQALTTGWSTGLDVLTRHTRFFDATAATDFTFPMHEPPCDGSRAPSRSELLRELNSLPRVSMSQATQQLGLCSLLCTEQLAPDDGQATVEAVTTGWPMRCISREMRKSVRDIPQSGWPGLWHVCVFEEGSTSVRAGTRSWVYFPKPVLVYGSLEAARLWIFPVGVLADTAFFGSAWFGVMLAVRGLRRWWLIRRGRCVACGYQVDDLPRCPECGAERATGRTHEQADVATNG